jgi:hypothetical protein
MKKEKDMDHELQMLHTKEKHQNIYLYTLAHKYFQFYFVASSFAPFIFFHPPYFFIFLMLTPC